jgi:hypothetical protein
MEKKNEHRDEWNVWDVDRNAVIDDDPDPIVEHKSSNISKANISKANISKGVNKSNISKLNISKAHDDHNDANDGI